MASTMRATSDIRPNWLFDASLMMGTTCPRIASMYCILMAPLPRRGCLASRQCDRCSSDHLIPARIGEQIQPLRRALQDTEPAVISQQARSRRALGLLPPPRAPALPGARLFLAHDP